MHTLLLGAFNEEEVEAFTNHNEFLAALWNMESRPIRYYKCLNLQEVYQLMGIDYHVDINGVKRGCVTLGKANLFVSGTNRKNTSTTLPIFILSCKCPSSLGIGWPKRATTSTLPIIGVCYQGELRVSETVPCREWSNALEIFEKTESWKPNFHQNAGRSLNHAQNWTGKRDGWVLQVITCGTTDDDFSRPLKR